MRQRLGNKKVAKLRARTGLDIAHAQVRGNTDHRIDLFLADGRIAYLYTDGRIEMSRWQWSERTSERILDAGAVRALTTP